MKKTFTAYQLKWMAIVLMVLDHSYKVFLPLTLPILAQTFHISQGSAFLLLEVLCSITTMSFFIFAYLCAFSCVYTKNRWKYVRNLFLFALLSEIPFQYFICILDGTKLQLHLGFTNVLVTLLLGVLSIFSYEALKKRKQEFIGFLCVAFFVLCAYLLQCDYDIYGVLAIFVSYYFKHKKYRLLPLGLVITGLYGIVQPIQYFTSYPFSIEMFIIFITHFIWGLLTLCILRRYEGEQGKKMKYFFYWFYPVHITILVALYICVS